MTSMILSLLVAAVTPAQVSAVKEHYLTLGSTAIEAKPVTTLPAETKVERVDASHQMRSASFGHKTTLVIELPQMVLGAILSLGEHDIYPVYTICWRVLDMTALNDQHYGGLIIWLPGTLTSFAAMIVVLVTMRLNEERAEREAA